MDPRLGSGPMHLSPHEQERLLIHVAADVAQRRRDRGLKLNHPEAERRRCLQPSDTRSMPVPSTGTSPTRS